MTLEVFFMLNNSMILSLSSIPAWGLNILVALMVCLVSVKPSPRVSTESPLAWAEGRGASSWAVWLLVRLQP